MEKRERRVQGPDEKKKKRGGALTPCCKKDNYLQVHHPGTQKTAMTTARRKGKAPAQTRLVEEKLKGLPALRKKIPDDGSTPRTVGGASQKGKRGGVAKRALDHERRIARFTLKRSAGAKRGGSGEGETARSDMILRMPLEKEGEKSAIPFVSAQAGKKREGPTILLSSSTARSHLLVARGGKEGALHAPKSKERYQSARKGDFLDRRNTKEEGRPGAAQRGEACMAIRRIFLRGASNGNGRGGGKGRRGRGARVSSPGGRTNGNTFSIRRRSTGSQGGQRGES